MSKNKFLHNIKLFLSGNKNLCYIFLNSCCLLVIFGVVIFSMNSKIENLRISKEILYLKDRITEQENYLKIYKAELSLLTNAQSLEELYVAYYKKDNNYNVIKMSQIKNITNLAYSFNSYKRYSMLKP